MFKVNPSKYSCNVTYLIAQQGILAIKLDLVPLKGNCTSVCFTTSLIDFLPRIYKIISQNNSVVFSTCFMCDRCVLKLNRSFCRGEEPASMSMLIGFYFTFLLRFLFH